VDTKDDGDGCNADGPVANYIADVRDLGPDKGPKEEIEEENDAGAVNRCLGDRDRKEDDCRCPGRSNQRRIEKQDFL